MKYTVILIRPDWVTDLFNSTERDEVDSYIALVEAKNPKDAVRKARLEVRRADRKDLKDLGFSRPNLELSTYCFVCAYEGHHKPQVLGVQTYMWK